MVLWEEIHRCCSISCRKLGLWELLISFARRIYLGGCLMVKKKCWSNLLDVFCLSLYWGIFSMIILSSAFLVYICHSCFHVTWPSEVLQEYPMLFIWPWEGGRWCTFTLQRGKGMILMLISLGSLGKVEILICLMPRWIKEEQLES